MGDLKPCPFCGGEASIGGGKDGSFVNCVDCLASTNTLTPLRMNEAEAIAAWNRRADTELSHALAVNDMTIEDCMALKAELAALKERLRGKAKEFRNLAVLTNSTRASAAYRDCAADLERVIVDE